MKKSFVLAGISAVLIISMASAGLWLLPSDEPQQHASPTAAIIASDPPVSPAPDEASSEAVASENERMTDPGSIPDPGGK
ncbi:MAG: hypothetical protein M1539_02340, partial [Actinobacteria bacterium]|nr:hypothetical protein [Actinomycetota bacterium]